MGTKKKPPEAKGRSRSKRVGGAYERKICTSLSLWVSDFKRKDVFWRSAMSGGRDTRIGAPSQAGDISAIHPLGHLLLSVFIIECKYRNNFRVETLLYNESSTVIEMFRTQVAPAAKRLNRLPMLIMHPVRRADVIIVNEEGWGIFHQCGMVPQITAPRSGLYFARYDSLMGVKYRVFKRAANEWLKKNKIQEKTLDQLAQRERL